MTEDDGRLLSAGVIALTTLVYLVNARFDHTWGRGIHLVYTAAAAAFVIVMAARTRVEDERPRDWQSILYIAAYLLALVTLLRLANVFGVHDIPGSSGTLVWVGLLLLGLASWFAVGRGSGISMLLAVVTAIVVVLAFIDWVFSPDGPDTFRWILLLLGLALFAGGFMSRGSDVRRSVAYVNGGGLAILALGLTFLGTSLGSSLALGGSSGTGWGWELMILGFGFASLIYSAHETQSGPGYLGAANLTLFVILAFPPGRDGASLIGWPLVLLLLSGAAIGAALRGNSQRP